MILIEKKWRNQKHKYFQSPIHHVWLSRCNPERQFCQFLLSSCLSTLRSAWFCWFTPALPLQSSSPGPRQLVTTSIWLHRHAGLQVLPGRLSACVAVLAFVTHSLPQISLAVFSLFFSFYWSSCFWFTGAQIWTRAREQICNTIFFFFLVTLLVYQR